MSKECFNGDGLHPKKSSKKDFIEDKRKEFDNDFVYDNHIRDVWDATKIKDFLTSSLNEAWEKGGEKEKKELEIMKLKYAEIQEAYGRLLEKPNEVVNGEFPLIFMKRKIEQSRQLAITNERERIRKWAEENKREELFVGETQYRFDKGNIAWVYNSALEDLKKFINTL